MASLLLSKSSLKKVELEHRKLQGERKDGVDNDIVDLLLFPGKTKGKKIVNVKLTFPYDFNLCLFLSFCSIDDRSACHCQLFSSTVLVCDVVTAGRLHLTANQIAD